MAMIDIFTWIVFLIMVSAIVGVIVLLGLWPGKIASARNHPQADAIAIGSWVSLVFGALLWPLVLVWAYSKPSPTSGAVSAGGGFDVAELATKINALQARIDELEQHKGEAP